MTSCLRRFGITLALLGFASTLPAAVGAQPFGYLTQWGSPGSGNGQFSAPYGVATDATGNIFVADTYNQRIQKFTNTGTYLTQWGSPGSGNGQFNTPEGVGTDAAGNVYVADTYNHRIQKFTGTGTYVTQWPVSDDTAYPSGVATDGAGNVYVVDLPNHHVLKFTATGTFLTQWGSLGTGNGQFQFPFSVATDAAGNVYVGHINNDRIQKFTNTGTYLTQWGSKGSGAGQFLSTVGVATDATGKVYVVDTYTPRVQVFTDTGTYLTKWGAPGNTNGKFFFPYGVATDAAGNVYVADQGNSRIQKFGPGGTPPIMHTITATAGVGGAIVPNGAVQVEDGTDQAFLIPTYPGYQLVDVKVDDISVGAVTDYTFYGVVGNHTIAATFVVTHRITATAGPGGFISPSGALDLPDGNSQTYLISPNRGYQVKSVFVDGVSQGPIGTYTFHNVVAEHSINVTFALTLPPELALDINQIGMLVSPAGSFAFNPAFASAGLEFPRGSAKTAVFASGLWLGAQNTATQVTLSEYSDEFGPGAMVNGGPDYPGRPEYHVYRLDRHYASAATRDSALAAYNAGAIPHGAPPVSVRLSGDLDILGDEMLWHVYNDADPARHNNRAGRTAPLGVEVQQTTYAFNQPGALGNTAFLRFKIINKGSNLLQNMYAALWSDPDLGGATDDLVGCDTTRSLGFCYNGTSNDAIYGSSPPAVGYDLLSAAKAGGSDPARGATSFIQYVNGGDPANATQSYNLLRGRQADGSAIINPTTNQPTSYVYSGDPVAGTGWLDAIPGDRRFMLSSGPLVLAPNETLELVGAIVIGDGTDRLSSITKLRSYDDEVQQFFDGPHCLAMPFTLARQLLNPQSQSHWVTGYLAPPAPYVASQIDVPSIRLNGVVAASSAMIKDDGTLKVKFLFDTLKPTLTLGDRVPVTVTGTVAGVCFTGSDTIEVKVPAIHKPDHDSQLAVGTLADVIWDADPSGATASLMSSINNGLTWKVEVPSIPNTGSYRWTVPGNLVSPARLAVVTVYPPDEDGNVDPSEYAISEAFTIVGPVGVGEGLPAEFALRGVTPNPAQFELRVGFSLRDSKPATLALYDVSGRQVAMRRVDGMGPGWHTVALGGRSSLSAGLYIIRLTQDGRSLTSRAALVR